MGSTTGGKKSGRGAISYLGVASVQRAASFVTLPLFAAALGPSAYGQIALLLTIYGLLTMLLPVGLETPLFRAMFSHDSKQRQDTHVGTLATALFIGPIALGGAFGVMVAFAPSIFGLSPQYLGLYVAAAGIFTAATIAPLTMLRARESYGSYALLNLAYAGTQLILRLLLVVVAGMGVRGWVFADLGAALFVLFLSLLWQGRLLSVRRFDLTELRSSLRMGLPMVPHLASHWVLNLSDRLIVAAFWSAAVVGVYSMGYQIAFVSGMAVTELNRAFLPRYGEAVRNPAARGLLSEHARQQILVTIGLTAGASLLGPQVVYRLLPASYSGAAVLIPWVALGFAFFGLYYIPMNLISIVAGDTHNIWMFTLGAAGVNVGTNFLFVPHFGPIAAAIDTTLGFFVLLVLMTITARRRCPTVRIDLRPIALVVPGAVAVAVIGSALSIQPGATGLLAALVASAVVVVLLGVGSGERPHRTGAPAPPKSPVHV